MEHVVRLVEQLDDAPAALGEAEPLQARDQISHVPWRRRELAGQAFDRLHAVALE